MSDLADLLAGAMVVEIGRHPGDARGHIDDVLAAVLAAAAIPACERAERVVATVAREQWCSHHVGLLVDLTVAIIDRTALPLTSLISMARQVADTPLTHQQ